MKTDAKQWSKFACCCGKVRVDVCEMSLEQDGRFLDRHTILLPTTFKCHVGRSLQKYSYM